MRLTRLLLGYFLSASASSLAVAAGIASCSSDIVTPYLALANYAPAKAFCSNNHPNQTLTHCDPSPGKRDQRLPTPSKATAVTALFHSFLDLPSSTTSSICACIDPATTTCPFGSFCSPSTSFCTPLHNCNSPYRCDGESFCGTSASSGGYMFCHPDTDTPDKGYCMSEKGGCPAEGEYEDCEENADCGGGWKVCLRACCREQPFCVDVREHVEKLGLVVNGTTQMGFG